MRGNRTRLNQKQFTFRRFLSENMLPFASCCQICLLFWSLLCDSNGDFNCEEFSVCILIIWQINECTRGWLSTFAPGCEDGLWLLRRVLNNWAPLSVTYFIMIKSWAPFGHPEPKQFIRMRLNMWPNVSSTLNPCCNYFLFFPLSR